MSSQSQVMVSMGINNAQFKKGVDEASNTMDKMISETRKKLSLKNIFETGAGFLTASLFKDVAMGIKNVGMEAINTAANLKDMAIASDTSYRKFQIIAGVAKLAGSSAEDANNTLIKLRGAIAAAMEKADSKQGMGFEALAINFEKLQKMDPADALDELASAFNNAKDRTAAFNALTDIFGEKLGPKMIQTLQGLGNGLEEAGKGMSLFSDAQAEAFKKTQDEIEQMKANFGVFVAQVIVGGAKVARTITSIFDAGRRPKQFDTLEDKLKDLEGKGSMSKTRLAITGTVGTIAANTGPVGWVVGAGLAVSLAQGEQRAMKYNDQRRRISEQVVEAYYQASLSLKDVAKFRAKIMEDTGIDILKNLQLVDKEGMLIAENANYALKQIDLINQAKKRVSEGGISTNEEKRKAQAAKEQAELTGILTGKKDALIEKYGSEYDKVVLLNKQLNEQRKIMNDISVKFEDRKRAAQEVLKIELELYDKQKTLREKVQKAKLEEEKAMDPAAKAKAAILKQEIEMQKAIINNQRNSLEERKKATEELFRKEMELKQLQTSIVSDDERIAREKAAAKARELDLNKKGYIRVRETTDEEGNVNYLGNTRLRKMTLAEKNDFMKEQVFQEKMRKLDEKLNIAKEKTNEEKLVSAADQQLAELKDMKKALNALSKLVKK